MKKRTLMTLLIASAALTTLVWAQPPDFAIYPGDERPRHERSADDRLARMVDYLELSEAQASEWEAITQEHLASIQARREQVGSLRDEFSSLAEQEKPNLEQLGQIALDLHREMKTLQSSRGEIFSDLEAILTPEQAEKLSALNAAREFSGPRGRRGSRDRWSPPDSD